MSGSKYCTIVGNYFDSQYLFCPRGFVCRLEFCKLLSLAGYERERSLKQDLVCTFLSIQWCLRIAGVHKQNLVIAFLWLSQFLLGQLVCLQIYVQEIQWTLPPIWHFFLFSFSSLLGIFKNTLFKRSLCSARVLPHTIILGVNTTRDIWNDRGNFLLVNFDSWMISVG